MSTSPAAFAVPAAVALFSLGSYFGLSKLFTLVPGSYHFYTPVTSQLVEEEDLLLKALWNASVAFVLLRMLLARWAPARVYVTLGAMLLVAGNLTAVAHLLAYVTTARESWIYLQLSGSDAVVTALALMVHAAEGGAAVFPVSNFPVALLPVINVALVAVTDALHITRAIGLVTSSAVVTWTYLRFFAPVPVAPGVEAAGYSGDAFAALSLFPQQMHAPLRPVNALLSSLFMPVVVKLQTAAAPAYAGSTSRSGSSAAGGASLPLSRPSGSGVDGPASSAPVSGSYTAIAVGSPGPSSSASSRIDLHLHLHGTGRLAGNAASPVGAPSDPVAERRRERALKALEQRLNETQQKFRKQGDVIERSGVATASTPTA
jgi:hypothetical protein